VRGGPSARSITWIVSRGTPLPSAVASHAEDLEIGAPPPALGEEGKEIVWDWPRGLRDSRPLVVGATGLNISSGMAICASRLSWPHNRPVRALDSGAA